MHFSIKEYALEVYHFRICLWKQKKSSIAYKCSLSLKGGNKGGVVVHGDSPHHNSKAVWRQPTASGKEHADAELDSSQSHHPADTQGTGQGRERVDSATQAHINYYPPRTQQSEMTQAWFSSGVFILKVKEVNMSSSINQLGCSSHPLGFLHSNEESAFSAYVSHRTYSTPQSQPFFPLETLSAR